MMDYISREEDLQKNHKLIDNGVRLGYLYTIEDMKKNIIR